MDETDRLSPDGTERELASELETWDWTRTAGVSADELRLALRASPGVEPGKAA